MDTINKIILTDNDGKTVTYLLNTIIGQEYQIFNFDGDNNKISLYIVAHPGKKYNIQLFNEKGSSKIYDFINQIDDDIRIIVTNPYYYNANNINRPKITISGKIAQFIDKIFYKKIDDDKYDDDKFLNKISSNENSYTGELQETEIGTYIFAYSLIDDDDVTKYFILDKKAVIGNNFTDFILLLPPPPIILATEDFSFDVLAFLYKMDLEVYFSSLNDTNLRIVNLIHNKGASNHDLSIEQMKGIEKGINYTLVVNDKITNTILYTQTILISNFDIKEVYYDIGFITIFNTGNKFTDLKLYDSYGNVYEITDEEQRISEN